MNHPPSSPPPATVVPTREGYNRWSEVYDTEDNCLIVLESRHIPPLLGDLRGKRVLDLGCGTGRHTLALARNGARVVGLDFSDGMLARAREKTTGQDLEACYLQTDLQTALPFRNATFDGIGCFLVIEHICNIPALMQEMQRVCRPGGFIILSAMHPALFLRNTQAGFPDPQTGVKIQPQSYPYSIADLFSAGQNAALSLDTLIEKAVTDELVAVSPKAAKYHGWPMLLLMRWKRK